MFLLQGLLNRDPQQRLGSNGGGEVMRHPFFSVINWDALYRREVTPPFDPCKNQDVEDATNFEADFTNMPLVSVDEDGRSDRIVSDTFQNFTYEEESHMSKVPAALGTSPSAKASAKASSESPAAGSSWTDSFSLFGAGKKK